MANKWQTLSQVIGTPWGNAQDGDLTISTNTTQASTSKSCTASGVTISLGAAGFTDGDIVMLWQVYGTGAGQWEFAKVASGGGSTSLTTQRSLTYSYTTGAVCHLFPQYGTVTIDSGKTLTATQWNGANGIVGFIARNVTVTGSVIASGKGFTGGACIGTNVSYQGYGYPGAGITGPDTFRDPNGNGGGAGKNYQDGNGGGGGLGTAGANATTNNGGYGGTVAGNAANTSLIFGGGGGASTISGNLAPQSGNTGGNGGGLIFIYAQNLTVTGSLVNTGANGISANGNISGAGAGGPILIKSANAVLGSTLTTALGGGVGAAGGVGRIHLDYGSSYSGTSNPTLNVTRDTSLFGSIRRTQFI